MINKIKSIFQTVRISLHNQHLQLLVIIVLVGAAFRFYAIPDRVYLTSEQSRDYFTSLVMREQVQFPLIGPFSSVAPLTGGPWYWAYLAVGWLLIPSVYAPWVALGLASLATVIVMYKIGNELHSPSLGLILASIAALSPTLIESTVYLTNPFLVGFLSTVSVYLFIKSFKGSSPKYIIAMGFFIGVAILTHYQALGLLILVLCLLLKKTDRIKTIIHSLLGLLIAALPVLLFELNNHWFNTRSLSNFILNGNDNVQTGKRWLTFLGDTLPTMWHGFLGTPKEVNLVVIILTLIALGVMWLRKKLPLLQTIFFAILLIQMIVIRYAGGEVYIARLQFLLPIVMICTGIVIHQVVLSHKLAWLLVPLYVLAVLPAAISIASAKIELPKLSQELAQIRDLSPNGKFSLYYCHNELYPPETKDKYLLALYINNMYDSEGTKLAVRNNGCALSDQSIVVNERLINISGETETVLTTNPWINFTPQLLYNNSAKWYYAEMP